MYADASGAISSTPGWKLTNGCWYYVGSDGSAVRNEIKEIGGKKYSFDWDGQMRTGKFDVWDGEKSNTYYADNTGAIITNKWTRDKMDLSKINGLMIPIMLPMMARWLSE